LQTARPKDFPVHYTHQSKNTKDEFRREVTHRLGGRGAGDWYAEKEAGGRGEGGKQRSRRLTIVGTRSSWFQSEFFTAIVLAFITEDVRSSASARHASVKITVTTHIYTHSGD